MKDYQFGYMPNCHINHHLLAALVVDPRHITDVDAAATAAATATATAAADTGTFAAG